MSIYTKSGDNGTTGLLNGDRVYKDDSRIELLGSLDEFTSSLGLSKNKIKDQDIKAELTKIQQELIALMGDVASGDGRYTKEYSSKSIEELIDNYSCKIPSDRKFIIPGDNEASSLLHISRSILRRAERALVRAKREWNINSEVNRYMNRLSDLLYVLALYIDFNELIINKVRQAMGEIKTNNENHNILNLKNSVKLIEKIENRANSMSLAVVIAVADDKGNIIAVHNMDGALSASLDIAVNKAYTSAALKVSTQELSELAKPGGPLYGISNTNNNRIIIFGGGIPLKHNKTVIGGLGISGGTAEQDIEFANYGAEIFTEVI